MGEYKHYIRINENSLIIKRFSSAFEQPEGGDICVNEDGGRHYNDPVTNERGQYDRQWIYEEDGPRSQTDLDAEWDTRPPAPPTPEQVSEQRIADLEMAIADIFANGGVI
ncbi:hypothetical protein G9U52_14870 [Paenibacillus sp. S3N08]|uniref:Uncharacterized protein n=2 Tax=Paenibacillus agricola TaxID=2716264 RepID=A0ABX0JAB5_9BACL|nr:hypothetical protein [Paenibacillus agricola]